MGTLTALRVKNAKPGEKLSDGGGLRLDVDKNGNASWLFRFKSPVTRKERFMGLGPLRDVGLADAREAAGAARALSGVSRGATSAKSKPSSFQRGRLFASE
jgi:hypothetical protein